MLAAFAVFLVYKGLYGSETSEPVENLRLCVSRPPAHVCAHATFTFNLFRIPHPPSLLQRPAHGVRRAADAGRAAV